jgi:hypothetical protein
VIKSLKAGTNVDAWCTKCRLVLAHTIEAVAAGEIKRVQCNTCGGAHRYRATEPGTTEKSPRASAKEKSSSPKSRAGNFQRLTQNRDATQATPYSMKRRFAAGELIHHLNFGLGVVVEEKDAQKIEVLFEAGPKVLVHGREA